MALSIYADERSLVLALGNNTFCFVLVSRKTLKEIIILYKCTIALEMRKTAMIPPPAHAEMSIREATAQVLCNHIHSVIHLLVNHLSFT